MGHDWGIIVPTRNEAALLPVTVPKLLEATNGLPVRIVWVCNGCSDGSAEAIRRLAGARGEVIELERPGKTAALQAGDEALGMTLPRLYLDADTWLRPGDPARLMAPVLSGAADLVAPRLRLETRGVSATSARIGACWLSLPHGARAAFSNAVGLSAAGRALWDRWPEITGDDIFISALVPEGRKMIVKDAVATIPIPRTFTGWVRMRARWLKGERELGARGLAVPKQAGQSAALLRRMVTREGAAGAWAYAAARVAAGTVRGRTAPSVWQPDRTDGRRG